MTYRFARHAQLAAILSSMRNKEFLIANGVYFAGGTSIALLYREVRESVDIDFLTASPGYAAVRDAVRRHGLEFFFPGSGRFRFDHYGVRGMVDGVKIEIVHSGYTPLSGSTCQFGIPALDFPSLYCEKLLANSDRHLDPSSMRKDIIDLGVLNSLPDRENDCLKGFAMAVGIFGKSVVHDYVSATENLAKYRKEAETMLHIDPKELRDILRALNRVKKAVQPADESTPTESPVP